MLQTYVYELPTKRCSYCKRVMVLRSQGKSLDIYCEKCKKVRKYLKPRGSSGN